MHFENLINDRFAVKFLKIYIIGYSCFYSEETDSNKNSARWGKLDGVGRSN